MARNPAPQITRQADQILAQRRMLNNPYFASLKNGGMDLAQFRRTQEQFYFAVTFYSRPMAVLMARLPDPSARLDILRNVVEEHGEFRHQAFHQNTFAQFLKTLRSPVKDLSRLDLWPEVRAFNSVLVTSCLMDEIEVGVGCMGIIEYAFAEISEFIGKTVVARGWVPPRKLVHYSLHASLDKRHAADFFAVVERGWKNPARRYFIRQGLELGAYIFDRLYRDLHGHP